MIAVVLLAAGAARRFGGAKLLAEIDHKPVIRRSAEVAIEASVGQVIVVVSPHSDALRTALAGLDVQYAVNENPARGIGSSLACGVASLPSGTKAILVALADEPFADRRVFQRVVARYRQDGAAVVLPTYESVRGHPVLFDASVFSELVTLDGDVGARDVVNRDVSRVAFEEIGVGRPDDVDTPEDLERLRAYASVRKAGNRRASPDQ